jgi:hypothetical protein
MHGTVNDGIYIKKESEKGKLRSFGKPLGSWTINLDEVNNQEIENIVYFTEKYIYRISYKKAFDKGYVKTLAGELKLIVPIKEWKREEK